MNNQDPLQQFTNRENFEKVPSDQELFRQFKQDEKKTTNKLIQLTGFLFLLLVVLALINLTKLSEIKLELDQEVQYNNDSYSAEDLNEQSDLVELVKNVKDYRDQFIKGIPLTSQQSYKNSISKIEISYQNSSKEDSLEKLNVQLDKYIDLKQELKQQYDTGVKLANLVFERQMEFENCKQKVYTGKNHMIDYQRDIELNLENLLQKDKELQFIEDDSNNSYSNLPQLQQSLQQDMIRIHEEIRELQQQVVGLEQNKSQREKIETELKQFEQNIHNDSQLKKQILSEINHLNEKNGLLAHNIEQLSLESKKLIPQIKIKKLEIEDKENNQQIGDMTLKYLRLYEKIHQELHPQQKKINYQGIDEFKFYELDQYNSEVQMLEEKFSLNSNQIDQQNIQKQQIQQRIQELTERYQQLKFQITNNQKNVKQQNEVLERYLIQSNEDQAQNKIKTQEQLLGHTQEKLNELNYFSKNQFENLQTEKNSVIESRNNLLSRITTEQQYVYNMMDQISSQIIKCVWIQQSLLEEARSSKHYLEEMNGIFLQLETSRQKIVNLIRNINEKIDEINIVNEIQDVEYKFDEEDIFKNENVTVNQSKESQDDEYVNNSEEI